MFFTAPKALLRCYLLKGAEKRLLYRGVLG